MTATLWLGLLLQVTSVAILFVAFRRSTFRRIGPYFVLSAFVYHGLTEIVQRMSGSMSTYRAYTSTAQIDSWTVAAGWAMLAFSAAYITAALILPRKTPNVQTAADVDRVVSVLDWRILAVLCVPLIAVVGTNSIDQQSGSSPTPPSALAGIAIQFLTFALALATISYVVQHKGRSLLPLIVQLGVTALIGSRLEVVTAAATTLFGLAILRRSPTWRQLATTAVIISALAVSISASRAHVGRTQFTTANVTGRMKLLATGAIDTTEGTPALYQGEQNPFGERLDGNSFPAAVLAAERAGTPPVHLTTVRNDLLLAVPSFINPAKLSTDLESRSEKAYLNDHFGVGINRDFLPTQLGTMLGYFGPTGLMFLSAMLGAFVGAAERVFGSRLSPARLVLTLALFVCVIRYESDMGTWLLEFRGALAVVAVVFLADWLRHRPDRRTSQPAHISVNS